ncbi:solute carrier organic anion transporter family member 6A1-like [Ctenodactylus gundi]
MKEVLEEMELAEDWEEQEEGTTKRKPPYLTMLPKAMVKFSNLPKKKKAHFLTPEKAPDPTMGNDSESPSGGDLTVIRCCQCFKDIRWFTVFLCILLISHGEPEELGHSGEGRGEVDTVGQERKEGICGSAPRIGPRPWVAEAMEDENTGILAGLTDISISEFEQQYTLTTYEKLGLILSYDITSCLVAVFIAYYGGRGNRLKWIALSSFLLGFASFLLALPFLTGKRYVPDVQIEDICQETKIFHPCQRSSAVFRLKYIALFILGQGVQGIATMPIYVLGTTFLDDNVPLHSSGLYLGFMEASQILGYASSYAMAAPLLKSHRDDASFAQPTKSAFLGGKMKKLLERVDLLISCTLLNICLAATESSHQPDKAKMKPIKSKQCHMFQKDLKDREFGANIKDMFIASWILLKNPVLLCQGLSKATESLALLGAAQFLPIYLETQFLLTPSMAAILTGIILIPANALGQLLGGFVVYTLEITCLSLMRFIIASSTVSLVFLGLVIFVHCDASKFAGISEDYDGTGRVGNITAPCNVDCKCFSSLYASVCGRDNIEYFSPCYAGCKASKTISEVKMYYNCSCIKEGLTTSDADGDVIDAVAGKCDMNCHKLPLFFAFMFSAIIFSGLCGIPIFLSILWTVPKNLHSLAMGITFVTIRIFGTIPGPLVFRKTAESSCILSDVSKCGNKGKCWIYNKAQMEYILLGICK